MTITGKEAHVALSEDELRLLEQMERALSEEDPKFASTLRGTTSIARARRVAIACAAGFVVGLALLLTGAVQRLTVVGVLGFVVMLGCASVGLGAFKQASPRTWDEADVDEHEL